MSGNNVGMIQQKKGDGGGTETQIVTYSAPLPPATEFERYEKVLSGSANRIMKLAENQNKHRRFIENILVITDSVKTLGGLIAALIIVLAGIFAGLYLIINDKSTEGFTTILSPLVTIILAFVYTKSKEGKEGK